MKKLLYFVLMLLVASPAFAADFDARQAVRINDGTNDLGAATANPFIVQLSDGTDTATIDGSGNLNVNIASGGSSPQEPDDSAFVIGTDNVSPMGALADETATDSVDEGDVGLVRMTLDRKLHTVIDDNGGSITVDGTVAATQSGTWNIGTVTTITNDVNIADGGNVISVDDAGASLTVDNPTLSVTGGGVEASALRVTIANDSTGLLSVDDNGSSLTVDASQLDIDNLNSTDDIVSVEQATHDSLNANVNLQVGDADVSLTNAVPVIQGEPTVSSNEIHDYDTAVAVAKNATDNHDYTVAGTTFFLHKVVVAASSNQKVLVQTGPVASLVTKAAIFTSAANPTQVVEFNPPIEVPVTSTGTVRLVRENKDNTAQDLYSTIIGYDV